MRIPEWIARASVDWDNIRAPHGQRAPISNLRELLRYEDRVDYGTRSRFEKWASGKVRDIRFEADTRIAALMIDGFIDDPRCLDLDFDGLRNEAKAASSAKMYTHAAMIYMGLIESLGVHIDRIDDSYAHFWTLFKECTEKVGECVTQSNFSDEEKRSIIWKLAMWSLVSFSDFMEYYEKVLTKLCINVEYLKVWRDTLEYRLETYTEDESPFESYGINKVEIESIRERVLLMIKETDTKEDQV